jgi:H+/Na+-translocating ferredoxin:NAD+ oxidoreductase subunit G
MKKPSMFKSIMMLTLVCLIAAILLGFAYVLTVEKISEQGKTMLNENLKQVFPQADDFIDKEGYYEVTKDSEVIGFAMIAESTGYSSTLKILVGMDLQKKITGIRIMEHEETPGLGANAVKSPFYEQFDDISVDDVKLSKYGGKVDAITAATITSEAVVSGVKKAANDELLKLVDDFLVQDKIRTDTEEKEKVGLANPASVYCEEQGGKLEIRDTESGFVGYCVFDHGECEEWAFYNEECEIENGR